MTETLKILGQVVPGINSLTDLYTVPASTSVSISSIIVCNQNSNTQILFSISVAVNGVSDDPKQYIYYNVPLVENDTFIATVGLTMGAGDILRIKTDSNNVSFNLFGAEVGM